MLGLDEMVALLLHGHKSFRPLFVFVLFAAVTSDFMATYPSALTYGLLTTNAQ